MRTALAFGVSISLFLLGLLAAGGQAASQSGTPAAAGGSGYDYEDGDSSFVKPSYIDGWDTDAKRLIYTRKEGLTFFGTDGKGRRMYPGAGARKCADGGLAPREGRMRVWFPGIRSAVLVENTFSSQTYRYLIDPGRHENGKDIVAFLKKFHITTLDAVILTHAHGDHYGAARAVLDAFAVKALYHPGWAPACANHMDWFLGLLRYAQQNKRVPVAVLTEGAPLAWPGLKVQVLGPPARHLVPSGWKCSPKDDLLNANSLVLRVSNGTRTVLLPADITVDSMWYQLKRHPQDLKSDVLLAPHHGIYYLKQFEDAVDAWRTIINWDHESKSKEQLQQASEDN
ncbi:MAG: MBL fold metallo-hydrolase [Elusimicrobia bacterium]|nr:MBL fold metallo-hydrolase [Elusimicrobiota bacterium]